MKNIAKPLVLIALVLSSFTAYSPASIKINGTVLNEKDGKPLTDVNVAVKTTGKTTVTNQKGEFGIFVPTENDVLIFTKPGFFNKEVAVVGRKLLEVKMKADPNWKPAVAPKPERKELADEEEIVFDMVVSQPMERSMKKSMAMGAAYSTAYQMEPAPVIHNTEGYATIHENVFHQPVNEPLSTFSIDVDAASYSNMRRFLSQGQKPPVDAVRIEEMVNYFDYDYPQPEGNDPFSINTELSYAPWNSKHYLVHIGLQGKVIPTDNLPPSNLVFLIDVSGSMSDPNKLPLLKSSFKLLTEQLRPVDKVAIVVYAGAAGLVLPPTSGSDKQTIMEAFDKLQAGGSTAGGAGIHLAYKTALENLVEGGNNRVILATDGDFNVGESSDASMERLIEQKRNDGIFLTVLGFGMGNYKDSKMEILADKGNGNYAYIDNILEAKKVLVNEFGGTLFTIAKDVKIQVEFNPAKVQAYRLIGYENRLLNKEDFNDDKKDAGELGSGHTVTALYEIIPVGVNSSFLPVDPLKYQQNTVVPDAVKTNELMTVKLRYKQPDGNTSKLLVNTIMDKPAAKTSENYRWSAAVAGFGMMLRNSEFKGDITYDQVVSLATEAKGQDKNGYRIEFINLVKSAMLLN
ncbi:MAG: VWA domain-containing protein [Imperialibacter sp.]|uniref:vWA domain-containing protein n=1 Tax=Imperialibacter sp. TaxID=2038411 RepID=UPI0032EE7F53